MRSTDDDVGRAKLLVTLRALLGCEVLALTYVRGGGNNEVYRADTPHGAFAVKRYFVSSTDRRDRIGQEYEALSFLAAAGETSVPHPVAIDRRVGLAVYEWIVGGRVEQLGGNDVAAALAFLGRLHQHRTGPAAEQLTLATEACLAWGALETQVTTRLLQLAQVSRGEAPLAEFIRNRFAPAWQCFAVGMRAGMPLPRAYQTLSPSDFGAHNMLRRLDGRLAFLDFEYFGWDDPVKLVADVVLHPGSDLGTTGRQAFVVGAQKIFGEDPAYAGRLRQYAPLFSLRWALIVLSEFIPHRWERRVRAGASADWETVKAQQLAKAGVFVDRCTDGFDSWLSMQPDRVGA